MPTYLPWLDLLRYVACVLVILSHLNPFPENNHFGHNGVALFFSISGYLIGSVLMNGQAKPGWVSRFYAHRLLRIYPPLLAGLAFIGSILAFVAAVYGRPGNLGLWEKGREFVTNLPYYMTFTAQLSPYSGEPYAIVWTLCVEEYFYLLLPLGFWLLGPRGTAAALIAVVIVTLEPRLRLIPGTTFGTWFLIPVNLLTGAALAVFRPPMRDGRPWAGFVGLAAVLTNAVFGFVENPFGPVMGLVTTLTVWSFATTRMPVPRPWGLLAKWGKWSYEIYLVHLPFCSLGNQTARELGRRLGLETLPRGVYVVVAAGVATVGATVLAAVLYRLIERPVRAARPWVTNRPWARRLAAAIQVSLVPAGIVYWLAAGGWSSLGSWWRSLVWIWDA
jgi:peptidoglycan/LPS O-acetylase OafA/YrhL